MPSARATSAGGETRNWVGSIMVEVKAALSALEDINDDSNKILDINSMMTDLGGCLKKAAEGTSGVLSTTS